MVKLMCDVKCALFFIQSVLDIFFLANELLEKMHKLTSEKDMQIYYYK